MLQNSLQLTVVTSPDRPDLSTFAGTYLDLMVKICFYDRKLITFIVLVFLKAAKVKKQHPIRKHIKAKLLSIKLIGATDIVKEEEVKSGLYSQPCLLYLRI